MRKLGLLLVFFLSLNIKAQNLETDSLLNTLKRELQYNMSQLKKQTNNIPYFMSLRMIDEKSTIIKSNLGAATINTGHSRIITPQIRLGNEKLDNFKYQNQGSGSNQRNGYGINIPITGCVLPSMRQAIWHEILRRYHIAVNNYNSAKAQAFTNTEDEDKAPCFSSAPVERYYEQPLPTSATTFDVKKWEARLNEITRVLRSYKDIESGNAELTFQAIRSYFTNSEGSEIVQNRKSVRILVQASVKAKDGMSCPLHIDYFAYDIDKMPSQDKMIQDAKNIIERLKALKNAPVADPYTGPAILSGPASGVFFHEIFGHRLEGHRLKKGGQTFKKMVGEQVLPTTFNVYCNPTLKDYNGAALNGYYLYDDEGVRARKVDCVTNGILKNFLMSRVPLDGFPESNGHGRTTGGNDPVSRQSNLIVETSKPYTEQQLRSMLIAEAKKQGKAYGYYFKSVTSGYTLTGEGGSLNSFNVTPLEVYRVYTDGRADELVRGVDMIGTPLSMFSNITAAGNECSTFTGMCGAESGWVPVSATSPMIYVSKIETQRRQENLQKLEILPAPETKDMSNATEDDIIFQAMNDEMKRTTQLTYPGYPTPFLVSYNICRNHSAYVRSSLGGNVQETYQPTTTAGSMNLSIGDSLHISDMQPGQVVPIDFTDQVDYNNIRHGFWAASDYLYKYGLSGMAQKRNYLANNPQSEEEKNIPDILTMKPTEIIESTNNDTISYSKLKMAAMELSAIFKNYPDIYNTNVNLFARNSTLYRLTSENVKLKSNYGYAEMQVNASVRTLDGNEYHENLKKIVCTDADLEAATLKAEIIKFAEHLMLIRQSKAINEYYCGPVMVEGAAISNIMVSNVLPLLTAKRTTNDGSSLSSLLVGKRILDSHLTICQYTDMPTYKNTKLIGNYTYDFDGVKPAKELPLLQGGFVKHLLCGRYPALNCLTSTGNNRFMNASQTVGSTVAPGILKITVDNAKPEAKMKDILCKTAKGQCLKTAFIIRQTEGCSPSLYRIDTATGKEELVRSSQLPNVNKSDLLHIIAASKEETITNTVINGTGASLITPTSIILENMEFFLKKPKQDMPFPVDIPK